MENSLKSLWNKAIIKHNLNFVATSNEKIACASLWYDVTIMRISLILSSCELSPCSFLQQQSTWQLWNNSMDCDNLYLSTGILVPRWPVLYGHAVLNQCSLEHITRGLWTYVSFSQFFTWIAFIFYYFSCVSYRALILTAQFLTRISIYMFFMNRKAGFVFLYPAAVLLNTKIWRIAIKSKNKAIAAIYP